MADLRAELIWLLFRLKPAIKKTVDKRRYEDTKASFKQLYRTIADRTDPVARTDEHERPLPGVSCPSK